MGVSLTPTYNEMAEWPLCPHTESWQSTKTCHLPYARHIEPRTARAGAEARRARAAVVVSQAVHVDPARLNAVLTNGLVPAAVTATAASRLRSALAPAPRGSRPSRLFTTSALAQLGNARHEILNALSL
jgi:hypothetical protein